MLGIQNKDFEVSLQKYSLLGGKGITFTQE